MPPMVLRWPLSVPTQTRVVIMSRPVHCQSYPQACPKLAAYEVTRKDDLPPRYYCRWHLHTGSAVAIKKVA